MKRLSVDDVRDALPDLDELRPVVDRLLAESEADGDRAWAGSGRLGTLGDRLIATGGLAADLETIADQESKHLRLIYREVTTALVALEAGDRIGAAEAFLNAAAREEGRDRPERAEAYAEAAYRAARNERDQRMSSLALRRWARAARWCGRLDDAHRRYEMAYEIAVAMSDARGAAEAAVGAGNVFEEQARLDQAEHWYRAALDALKPLDTPTPERWHALVTLHIVARWRGNLEESASLLYEAEEAAAAVDPQGAAPFLLNARGQLRMSEGAFTEAEADLRSALEAATDARASVTIRLNLAEAILAQGRTLDAAEHARLAERDAIRAHLLPKLPEVYRVLGRIASMEGDASAMVFFERALEIVHERRLPALEEALTLQAYADAEARRGEGDTARALRQAARDRLRELGINELRLTWADVFAPDEENRDIPAPEPQER